MFGAFSLGVGEYVQKLDSRASFVSNGKQSPVLEGAHRFILPVPTWAFEDAAPQPPRSRPRMIMVSCILGGRRSQARVMGACRATSCSGVRHAVLYLREMQRLGLAQRALVVCPANRSGSPTSMRFLGCDLRQRAANTVRKEAVGSHDVRGVSLELSAPAL